jgi:hypothetical protein
MGVPDELKNARLTAVERPVRGGPGGDITSRTSIYSAATLGDYDIVYEPTDRLWRTADGRDITLDAFLFIDRVRSNGVILDVVTGDQVSWVDQNERTFTRAEVKRVLLQTWPGSTIDHWELAIVGG